jgi:hypothetical protein
MFHKNFIIYITYTTTYFKNPSFLTKYLKKEKAFWLNSQTTLISIALEMLLDEFHIFHLKNKLKNYHKLRYYKYKT